MEHHRHDQCPGIVVGGVSLIQVGDAKPCVLKHSRVISHPQDMGSIFFFNSIHLSYLHFSPLGWFRDVDKQLVVAFGYIGPCHRLPER
jgi:hypothetical protein